MFKRFFRFIIPYLIPFTILLLVLLAPILLKIFLPETPAQEADKTPLSKVCFGIVVPKDIHQFVLKQEITFNDMRAKKNDCFGVDVYY